MEPLVRELGDQLVRRTTRRGFLGRTARFLVTVGTGVLAITTGSAVVNPQIAFAVTCPCGPAPTCPSETFCGNLGYWCPDALGSCPDGCTATGYNWWCCQGGLGVQCTDCSGGGCGNNACHECICQHFTQITC
jgi:hypothetical protein